MTNRRRTYAAVILLAGTVLGGGRVPQRVTIYLIGDSTMADKPIIDNPERGWGQMFPRFFDDGVVIRNHARNGRSTKSFIEEGRWNAVVRELKPGDYVFIQFGHNDAKRDDSTRFAAPQTTFRHNLLRFVKETRSAGAMPVLLTPVHRRKFDSTGQLIDQHGLYASVVREVARDEHVPLIDLHERSRDLFERAGPEGTKSIFLWIRPGLYPSLPQGKEDNTHFTKYGAVKVAELVIQGLIDLGLPVATHRKAFAPDSLPGLGKIVTLDYYYNCEWKKVNTTLVQFHYVWEDTANSGFSELARTIDDLGAGVVGLHRAPSLEDLRKTSVYIIVDPDTQAESDQPHSIEPEARRDISQWVREGGALVLMGNDSGNAEFPHLNELACSFGIQFNGDSHHHVVGREYDLGKSADLPVHPIFTDVKQIFTKEISSLRLAPPAEPILKERGLVLMASSRAGKGVVFAVGDPWLYNEYIDARRLPSEFENRKAGENLFRWLLGQAGRVP